MITALKSQALLNESVGAGYIERNWPPAQKESGEWPLTTLRQSFLNGSLTRLLDPDTTLRGKIVEFVSRGDFGLASGRKPDGTYERVWFGEMIGADEVTFESDVFLLLKTKAKALKAVPEKPPDNQDDKEKEQKPSTTSVSEPPPPLTRQTFQISGEIPPEIWNRLGTCLLYTSPSPRD